VQRIIAVNKLTVSGQRLPVTQERCTMQNHDDVNVIALASDYLNEMQAKAIVEEFLKTSFDPQERFVRRIGKITQQEAAS
jgi:ribose 5-phosphate isomerase RpiB